MRSSEIEYWVLEIVDRVKNNQPIEDSRIELKAEWPEDHAKAARRIAGHANSARGEPILWIIGLDEKRGIKGADQEELADWWAQIKKRFDEQMAPSVIDLSVAYEGKTLMALLMQTDRAPFVVKNHRGGSPEREVPWREGTAIRSVLRSDLLKLLVPLQRVPKIDLLEASLEYRQRVDKQPMYFFALSIRAYCSTLSNEIIVIPFHKCDVRLKWGGQVNAPVLSHFKMNPPHLPGPAMGRRYFSDRPPEPPNYDSFTITATNRQLIVSGPDIIFIKAEHDLENKIEQIPEEIRIVLMLEPSEIDKTITIEQTLVLKSESPGDVVQAEWSIRE